MQEPMRSHLEESIVCTRTVSCVDRHALQPVGLGRRPAKLPRVEEGPREHLDAREAGAPCLPVESLGAHRSRCGTAGVDRCGTASLRERGREVCHERLGLELAAPTASRRPAAATTGSATGQRGPDKSGYESSTAAARARGPRRPRAGFGVLSPRSPTACP
eukprot:scaffold72388_cov75-Phaeocystis_antarctica.AAC.2